MFLKDSKHLKTITATRPAFAGLGLADAMKGLSDFAVKAGLKTNPASPDAVIENFILFTVGLLMVLLLCMIIYGGYKWMTAGGDEKSIKAAKQLLINAALGGIIILSAWIILRFTLGLAQKARDITEGKNKIESVPSDYTDDIRDSDGDPAV